MITKPAKPLFEYRESVDGLEVHIGQGVWQPATKEETEQVRAHAVQEAAEKGFSESFSK